jgi:hypothetical protein
MGLFLALVIVHIPPLTVPLAVILVPVCAVGHEPIVSPDHNAAPQAVAVGVVGIRQSVA